MILKLENYNSFYNENYSYNQSIKELIEELFTTNSFGHISYKISTLQNFSSTKRHHSFNPKHNINGYMHPQGNEDFKGYSRYEGKLGPLEFSIINYILNHKLGYDVFVLTGALGSGKSSISNYILDFMEKLRMSKDNLFFPANGIVFRVNFNEHFNANDKDEIVEEFKILLIEQSISLIGDFHEKKLFINHFIQKIRYRVTIVTHLFNNCSNRLGYCFSFYLCFSLFKSLCL